MTNQIPNKIYLSEDEMPAQYYNLRSDMKIKPAPLLNPATLQPVSGGTALSMACAHFGLDCKVFMVKVSYEQKPFRREVMRTYGADVTPSPSEKTAVGRKILSQHPGFDSLPEI